jgi:hypothetical protein
VPERAGGRVLWVQVFSFSIDKHGDLYAANNTSSFFRFRPTNAECSHYFRVWGAELEGEGRNASGICSTGERVFALYMTASPCLVRPQPLYKPLLAPELVSLARCDRRGRLTAGPTRRAQSSSWPGRAGRSCA